MATNITEPATMDRSTQAPLQINTFVVYDLETTGFDRPKITEMSMIAVHRNDLLYDTRVGLPRVLNKLTFCVYPMKTVAPMVADSTGLYNDNLYFQKDFDEESGLMIMSFLRRLAPPVCLIAHNGNAFDHGILRNELDFSKTEIPGEILCADSLACFRQLDTMVTSVGQVSSPAGEAVVTATPSLNKFVTKLQSATATEFKNEVQNVRRELFRNSSAPLNVAEITNFDWSLEPSDDELSRLNFQDLCNGNEKNLQISFESKQVQTDEIDVKLLSPTPKFEKVPTVLGTPKRPIKTQNMSQETPSKKMKRLSYKLGDIYQREVKKPPKNSHSAEGDCLMLLKIMRTRAPAVCEWMDNNAVPFINIQPRYKLRYQRNPLPTSQFPFQNGPSQN